MFRNKQNLRNVVAIAICLAAMTMFSGCNEEGESDNIVGTTWAYTNGGNYETFYFKSNSICVLAYENWSSEHTYAYNKPNISISVSGGVTQGIIKGNTMTLVNPLGQTLIFVKL